MEIPITFRCNNNCISCIIDSRLGSKKGHLPWSEIRQRIDSVPKTCDTVGITGGEPTISSNLFRTISRLSRARPDILVFLVTNGRMFSYPEFARKLSGMGIKNLRVGIAIYSHDPEIHDSITMCDGSWKQTVSGIKNLLGLGIRVELRIIVSKLNFSSLDRTAEFVSRKLKGVERVVFINMKYTGNAFLNRKEIFIRYGELVPHVTRSADILLNAGIDVKLFHFPLCTLPEGYRELAKGVTKQKSELAFVDACKTCSSMQDCPMIWKTYLTLAGDDEFAPI
jgi:His-Xaa-Ser system radical SAM maturase HxsC